MTTVVGFGEILLRLSPPNYQILSQTTTLDCQFGGSELNVLATLAQLGHGVSLVSAIPDNDVGNMAETFLFNHHIASDHVVKTGDRLGLYYYQKGFSLRPSRVTYDRKYSAFSETTAADYDVDAILAEASWFHVSGITIALNPAIAQLAYDLMAAAKAKGIPVSFDLNYRDSLWESFDQARQVLSPYLYLADVCIGLEPVSLLQEDGQDLKDQRGFTRPYRDRALLLEVLREMAEQYSLSYIGFTEREVGTTSEYGLKAFLYDGNKHELHETPQSRIQVLDRVGTGDAYTAGLIYGLLEQLPVVDVLATAMAIFQFKHTIEGDINLITKQDIDQVMTASSYDIKR